MIRRYILPILATLGVLGAVAAVVSGNRQSRVPPPAVEPPQSAFSSYAAGVGSIEASTGNIVIGTPVAGILRDIYVKVGDPVKAGDPLFKIDDRELQAQLLTALAKIAEAEAALKHPRHSLSFTEHLVRLDKSAVSEQDMIDLRDQVTLAKAFLELAKAQAQQLRMEIARHTVYAPVSGRVLQLRARVGEYAREGAVGTPPLVVGDDEKLYVRVDVDENDAWRIRPDARALAFVRGNPDIEIPLRFEYVEPYMVPKTFLTGLSTERTDVRVLQALYGFERGSLPVYIGQRVDVYIEAPPTGGHAAEGSR